MRRKEFNVENREEIEQFLKEKVDGVLTFRGTDGWPKAVPLNYVYHDGAVYFHGSKIGEKMSGLSDDPRAEFVAYEAHAFIPSYFMDPVLACPATVFFRSVRIRGVVVQVEDAGEKALALAALMGAMQPEGGHAPIDPADPKYVPQLKGVAVLRLDPESVSGKFKFGQNMSEKRRDGVLNALGERGLPGDAAAMEWVRAKAPVRTSRSDPGDS